MSTVIPPPPAPTLTPEAPPPPAPDVPLWGPAPPPPPAPPKRHRFRNAMFAVGAVFLVLIIIGVAASIGQGTKGTGNNAAAPAGRNSSAPAYVPPPVPEASPDGTFTSGECDYTLGKLTGFTWHPKAIAATNLANTGNIGTVVRVKAWWQETGHASLTARKVVRLGVGQSRRVVFSVPIPASQLDGLQNAAFNNHWCGVRASIVSTFGVPQG